jgi:hypothetical protein
MAANDAHAHHFALRKLRGRMYVVLRPRGAVYFVDGCRAIAKKPRQRRGRCKEEFASQKGRDAATEVSARTSLCFNS